MSKASIRAGIIGWPVAHSLSPVLHGYWLKQYGIDGEMLRLPAAPEEFSATIGRLHKEGFVGVNVTVPHKQAAFLLADSHTAAAGEAGAANLLLFAKHGGLYADNTDTYGLVQSLKSAVLLDSKTVVLLGAGGAARGALLALHQLRAAKVHILSRRGRSAEILAATLQPLLTSRLVPGELEEWPQVAGEASLLLNATSAGMAGQEPLGLNLAFLPREAAVCDIVYNPLETALLKDATAGGHKTIDGLGMLMHQAVPSFQAFFGTTPQVTSGLRAALIEALNAR